MIEALNDFVILSYDKKKDDEGVIRSDVSKSKPAIMKIESIGAGANSYEAKVGDYVLIDPFIPREVLVDNKKYYIVKSKEIFAIIK